MKVKVKDVIITMPSEFLDHMSFQATGSWGAPYEISPEKPSLEILHESCIKDPENSQEDAREVLKGVRKTAEELSRQSNEEILRLERELFLSKNAKKLNALGYSTEEIKEATETLCLYTLKHGDPLASCREAIAKARIK